MINWIIIDDITYQWSGNAITCNTEVGYSVLISGSKLENIDISDKENNICGHLSVDFLTNMIVYTSPRELFEDGVVVYSLNGVQHRVFLSEIVIFDDFVSQNSIEHNQDDLWSEISNYSHAHINNSHTNFSIDQCQILEAKDSYLDFTLSGIENNQTDNISELYDYHGAVDVELIYIQSEIDIPLMQNVDGLI
nr:hypothetical protein [uncultured Tolumonas sp.]